MPASTFINQLSRISKKAQNHVRTTAFLLCLFSCSRIVPPVSPMGAPASPILRSLASESPPCLGLVKDFCQNLYAPGNQGSLAIDMSGDKLEIRRGKTQNDFSQIYFEYAQTQIRYKEKLPRAFRAVLTQNNYFKKLSEYLERKPTSHMTLDDRLGMLRLAGEIDAIWSTALNQTVLERMEKKFQGFSRIPEDLVPIELRNESKRTRAVLLSEIAKAFWTDHPNWKKVQGQFREVRKAYKNLITQSKALPPKLKKDWLKRIDEVRLIVPGSDPEVDMLACSRTDDNAFYYSYKDYLTVCAGDFNAEGMLQTLSHELAHVLDFERSLVDFESESKFGEKLEQLREVSCSGKEYSCRDWTKFKSNFAALIDKLEAFEPPVVEYNRCLKSKTTRTPIPDDYLQNLARDEARGTVQELAEKSVFLRLITPQLPMPDGTFQTNPMFQNPCAYYLWDQHLRPFDETLSTLLFFTTEYRCSAETHQEERFRSSIETAVNLQTTLTLARLRQEGEFSARKRLVVDGYSSSPDEHFADSLAGEVFARILEQEHDVAKRRALYLTNVAWACPKPSLQGMHPAEARVQNQYILGPYSDDFSRQKELLPRKIREVLSCEADFERPECDLESRAPASPKSVLK